MQCLTLAQSCASWWLSAHLWSWISALVLNSLGGEEEHGGGEYREGVPRRRGEGMGGNRGGGNGQVYRVVLGGGGRGGGRGR